MVSVEKIDTEARNQRIDLIHPVRHERADTDPPFSICSDSEI
jgi:hypothetical protein